MSHICFRQKRIINLKLPKGYDQAKIQIGIPVTENENKKINLFNIGDIVLPSGEFGSVCKKNAYGYSYTDKTQPKQRRYVCTNWIYPYGNENASKVAADIYKPCFPQVEVPPTGIELSLFEDKNGNRYVVAVLNSIVRDNYLKETVNIFLEIYGFCYVFSNEIILKDRVKCRRCNWEILPPGEKPSSHLINILNLQGEHTDTFDVARLKLIETYKAEQVVEGINGFHGYYAYIFTEYCVLESAIYGNATYIIPKENWEVLSQKTKQELIKDNKVIEKVIHTEKWMNTINKTFKKLTILKK